MSLLDLSTMTIASRRGPTRAMTATLYPLSLDALTIAEDQVTGTKVGTIIRGTPGSTITLQAQSNANMFALSNGDINVGAAGLDFETAPAPTITVRETLAGAVNTPKDTVITITVTDTVEAQAAWPSLIGAEMMTNGDCSSGTGWTLPAGVVIAAGKMTATACTNGVVNSGVADTSFINGGTYRCVLTIDSRSAGSLQQFIGTTAGTIRSTVATFSEDIIAAGVPDDGGWVLSLTSATMQLDNFSVKSVGQNGVETDWTFVGGATSWNIDGGRVQFADAGPSDTAALTGTALTSFAATVSLNTAVLVSFYVSPGSYSNGSFSFRIHNGSWVDAGITAGGWSTPVAATTGAVAGFETRGQTDGLSELEFAIVQIALA